MWYQNFIYTKPSTAVLILIPFPPQWHFLMSYNMSMWIMERNKSLPTQKKKADRIVFFVLSLSSYSTFQRGRNVWDSGRQCGGGGREQPCCRGDGCMTLLFSPQLTMDVLSVHGSLCGCFDGHPWLERTFRELFKLPCYFSLAAIYEDGHTPTYWLRKAIC